MGFFHDQISTDHIRPPPAKLIKQAEKLARSAKTPEQAKAALDQLVPEISCHAPDSKFLLSCGTLLEKKRVSDGMLDAWLDLCDLFPEELLPVRMLMRWFRRLNQVEEGLQHLMDLCPDNLSNFKQAEQLIFGLIELKDFTGLDNTVSQVLASHPDDTSLRLRYAQILFEQERTWEASTILSNLGKDAKLSPAAQKTVNEIETRAAILESHDIVDSAAMIGKMVESFADQHLRARSENGLGPVIFYTGQLGAGGAERQMTRIAAAFKHCYDNNVSVSGLKLLAPPRVCVRHTNPATHSGFFRPVLEQTGIEVHVLNDEVTPEIDGYPEITDKQREMLDFLPTDIYQNTLKLIRYFKETEAEYVYCWQDGGVLTAALAALIAGVPRIITSFRGMPPNLRPELLRPQMPYLHKALRKIPQVSFSANNAVAARAYEAWLGFETGDISVIHNAVPAILPDGDETAHEIWDDITTRSPECNKTVLGVFRLELVKNPFLWVDVAGEYIKKHNDTRFVAFGRGTLLEACKRRVAKMGLEDRIFLGRVTSHVGFFMHKADVVLHLARTEGLPNVVIEGHLSGTPVLATPAGGTCEVLENGVTGFLLSQADSPPPEEIIGLLERILSDPALMQKMGKAAKQHAEAPFFIDHILDKTVSLFLNERK